MHIAIVEWNLIQSVIKRQSFQSVNYAKKQVLFQVGEKTKY